MRLNFRLRLAIIMIIFVVIIAFTIAILNFLEYKKQVESNETLQLKQVEDTLTNSLETLDKAYYLFDQQTTRQMEKNSSLLIQMYDENDHFEAWDLNSLSTEFGMDIYIIDENNVVKYSSFDKDADLDFSACCQKLIPMFNERREKSDFFSAGIDVEQTTGSIKKFTYAGTPDGRYIIELGYSLDNDEVFGVFSFLDEVEHVEQEYPLIHKLRVLNIGGLAVGDNQQERLSTKKREAFEKALKSKETTEVVEDWQGEEATYRYVYYNSDITEGRISEKVIEVAYDHNEVERVINKSFKTLIIQLVFVLVIISLISLIIHYWVSQQVYLAQHDSLTGLKNRAAFEEMLQHVLENKKEIHALFMIDLDNFKTVNDTLGHTKGDHVLKIVSNTLRTATEKVNKTFSIYRVGGDEFTIILPETNEKEMLELANYINDALSESLTDHQEYKSLNVSASIGIAVSDEGNTVNAETLYKQADIALYMSKRKGKKGYHLYSESAET